MAYVTRSLQERSLCLANVFVDKVRPGSMIRVGSADGARKIKNAIAKEEFADTSAIYVMETTVGTAHIQELVEGRRGGAELPGGFVLTKGGVGILPQLEEDPMAEERVWSLIDGGHRLAAMIELRDEAPEEEKKLYEGIKAIICEGMEEEEMVLFAASLNAKNTKYVETRFTDRQEQLKRWFDLWAVKKQAEVDRLVAEDLLKPSRQQVWTAQKIKKALSITAFLSEKEVMCAETKTDFVGVFGFNPKSGQVQVSLARSLHKETIDYLRELAIKDVSMYPVVTVHVVCCLTHSIFKTQSAVFQFRSYHKIEIGK